MRCWCSVFTCLGKRKYWVEFHSGVKRTSMKRKETILMKSDRRIEWVFVCVCGKNRSDLWRAENWLRLWSNKLIKGRIQKRSQLLGRTGGFFSIQSSTAALDLKSLILGNIFLPPFLLAWAVWAAPKMFTLTSLQMTRFLTGKSCVSTSSSTSLLSSTCWLMILNPSQFWE